MKQLTRRMGTVLVGTLGLWLAGCSGGSAPAAEATEGKMGQLALPLVTQGSSGTTYRLRDATFAIHHYNYGPSYGYGGSANGGSGGSPGETVVTASSETDPDAQNITLSVEEGQYYVELLPGWHFEKSGPMGVESVEATLLSGQTQWVWVSRQSTSFAEFQFGLGGRELWLNGQLNIDVVLYENPSEVYPNGGYGGNYGSAGSYGGGPIWVGGSGGSGGGL